MALNYVTLTGTVPGGAGAVVTAILSGWQPDPTDLQLIPPAPQPVTIGGNGQFSLPGLVANDNANIPPGSYWTVSIEGIRGIAAPFVQTYVLNYANGATQDISKLTPAVPTTPALAAYMLLPSGTPAQGDAPVIQGNGQPAWAPVMVSPMTAAGDLIQGGSGGAATRLGGNTSAAREFLASQGTGSAANPAAWTALQAGDIPDLPYVDSVAAGDASVVVGGSADAPTVATGTLDVIATQHPPAANWSNNSKRITSLGAGSAGTDAAQYGQTLAGGDGAPMTTQGDMLYQGSGAPARLPGDTSNGRKFLRTQSSSGTAQPPAWDTLQAADIPDLPYVDSVAAADASVVVGGTADGPTVRTGTLDSIASQHPPTAAVGFNGQKATGLANGTASSDAAAFGQIPTSAGAIGGLLAANSLSDVASASTARTNLGLGTAALLAAAAVLQAANNLADLASASTARSNLGLGTAALLASAAVAQTANNLSDLASAATARTNLGLGSAATQPSSAFLQPANNLSDVGSAATARTNLGLGSAATQNSSAFDAAGAAAAAQAAAEAASDPAGTATTLTAYYLRVFAA